MIKRLPQIVPEQLRRIKRTRTVACMATALIVAVLMSVLFSAGFYSNIQVKLSDYLYGGGSASDIIVIVSIDVQSIQDTGRWP
ncbi:hypothetical protein KY363_01530, partial [Candidatus Woesearchaeota archaeon]|nr:hypothetical protein [Candidatus Woesearchaeota archaeon]